MTYLKRFIIVISLMLMVSGVNPLIADETEAEEIHYLAFASDYHNTEGSIKTSMTGMPESVEYVSLIGDMVGEGGGTHPEYNSKDILELVQEVFKKLNNTNVSIIWADHDMSVIDEEDVNIVKCKDGYESGVIYEGKNKDGSIAYYIYGIGFYHMLDGGTVSSEAAEQFKKWVDTIDKGIPVIALCHAPIQALRGDNNGAVYWNEALNYAATGVEGINTKEETADIKRDVFFFHGHNHTNDKTEYYFAAGTTMIVQEDSTAKSNLLSATEDENLVETAETLDTETLTMSKGKGEISNIYYHSLTVGYLKTSGNATLLSISDGKITLEKYNDGEKVNVGVDAEGTEAGTLVEINAFTRSSETKHDEITIRKVDEQEELLEGATFALLDEDGNQLATYSESEFTISTNDEVLQELLPDENQSVTLYLKEIEAPEGYRLNSDTSEILISNDTNTVLNDHDYHSTITYSITIDDNEGIDIINEKLKDVTVTLLLSENGTVSIDGNTYSESTSFMLKEGNSLDIVITPDSGYKINKILMNGKNIASSFSNGKGSIDVGTEDIELYISFSKINEYQIPVTGVE